MRKTAIKLTCKALGWERDFAPDHAERLLALRNNGGWTLPDNSPYEYSRKHGIAAKRHQRNNEEGQE